MIEMKVTVDDETDKVERAVERTSYRNLGHAVASIHKEAAASLEISSEPSEPSEPPHTRLGQFRRALQSDVEDKRTAVVGPRASIVGESAAAHEHGEEYRGDKFPERPFMGPVMEANLDRFARGWGGSLR